MSKKINELAYEIICKTEQVKAIQRVEGYMRDDLVKLKFQIPVEEQTFEVLDGIKNTFLTDIDKLGKEIEKLSCTSFQL